MAVALRGKRGGLRADGLIDRPDGWLAVGEGAGSSAVGQGDGGRDWGLAGHGEDEGRRERCVRRTKTTAYFHTLELRDSVT